MSVLIPGGAIALNRRRITSITWPRGKPYGEIAAEFYLGGVRQRVIDSRLLYKQAVQFDSITPQTWVLRYTLAADADYKWKTQAELDASTMFANAVNDIHLSTNCPTAKLTRVSDKVVECDVTPQVSGAESNVSPDLQVEALNSRLYIVRENGDAITATEQPKRGDFVMSVFGSDHFVRTTYGAGTPILATFFGEATAGHQLLLEGVPTTVASGYASNDFVGLQYEIPLDADPARFTDLLVDFAAGFVSLSGHEVSIVLDADNWSFPGRETISLADFTDIDGTFASMVDGLVADSATRGPLSSALFGDAEVFDEGEAIRVRFQPGYTPRNPQEISDPSANLSGQTKPTRPNPYAAPYDTDIGYGWVWGDQPTLTVTNKDGVTLATINDLESIIPAFNSSGDFVQVGSNPGVYVALFELAGLPGLSRLWIRVIDDTLSSGDEIFIDRARPDNEL